jgi:hypothetical protein
MIIWEKAKDHLSLGGYNIALLCVPTLNSLIIGIQYWDTEGLSQGLKSGGPRLVTELRPITWHVRLGPGPLGDNHTIYFFLYGDQSVGVYRYIYTYVYIGLHYNMI